MPKTSSEENGKVRKFQMKGICEGSKMKGWRLWWLKLLGLSSKISRARKFWPILNGAEHCVIKFTALSSFEYWMHVSRGWSLRLSLQQSFPSSEFEICNFHFPWKVFPPAFGPRPVNLLPNSFIFLSNYQVWSLSFLSKLSHSSFQGRSNIMNISVGRFGGEAVNDQAGDGNPSQITPAAHH